MFERFTERARQVVVLAQDEARTLQHNYIGTEHLLLGVAREDEGVAARVLENLDVTVEEVRAQVDRIVGHGGQVPTGHIPFTPRAKKALELSLREAIELGHNYIGPEHVLLGLARESEGVAARILLDFGADLPKIRREVLTVVSSAGGPPPGRTYRASPAVPPELVDEIEKVAQEKEEAIEAQDFERAARLTERERNLRKKARELAEGSTAFGVKDDPSSRLAVGAYLPSGMERIRLPLVLGWALFGVAFGLGILAGWLIWG